MAEKLPAERAAEAWNSTHGHSEAVEYNDSNSDEAAQWVDIEASRPMEPDGEFKVYGNYVREALHLQGLVITGFMVKDNFKGDIRIWVHEVEDIETAIVEEEVVETVERKEQRLVTR